MGCGGPAARAFWRNRLSGWQELLPGTTKLSLSEPLDVRMLQQTLRFVEQKIAAESAKVRRVYDQRGIAERTVITFFQAGLTMHSGATLEFIEQQSR